MRDFRNKKHESMGKKHNSFRSDEYNFYFVALLYNGNIFDVQQVLLIRPPVVLDEIGLDNEQFS